MLRAVADGSAELMVASHNQASVAAAAAEMRRLGLDPATSGMQSPPLRPAWQDFIALPLGTSCQSRLARGLCPHVRTEPWLRTCRLPVLSWEDGASCRALCFT